MEELHQFFSYFVVLLLPACVVNALVKMSRAGTVTGTDQMVYGFCFWVTAVEIALGAIVYLSNQSYNVMIEPIFALNPNLNFFGKTHAFVMTGVLILMIIGYVRYKKAADPKRMHTQVALFYGLSFVGILLGVPWFWGFHG